MEFIQIKYWLSQSVFYVFQSMSCIVIIKVLTALVGILRVRWKNGPERGPMTVLFNP